MVDFMVLRQHYDIAKSRNWKPGTERGGGGVEGGGRGLGLGLGQCYRLNVTAAAL